MHGRVRLTHLRLGRLRLRAAPQLIQSNAGRLPTVVPGSAHADEKLGAPDQAGTQLGIVIGCLRPQLALVMRTAGRARVFPSCIFRSRVGQGKENGQKGRKNSGHWLFVQSTRALALAQGRKEIARTIACGNTTCSRNHLRAGCPAALRGREPPRETFSRAIRPFGAPPDPCFLG